MRSLTSLTVMTVVLTQLAACAGPNRSQEEALNWAAGIDVAQTADDVSVFLPETVLFDSARSDLRTDAGAAIDRSAAILARSDKHVVVEGHTDNVGSHEANLALSEARAMAVADALKKDGIPASRITVRGYAYDRPIAGNDTEEGRAQNRRAEIRIQGESIDKVLGRGSDRLASTEDEQHPTAQAESLPSRKQPATPPAPARAYGTPASLVWPVEGKLAAPFVPGKARGILITGKAGEPVKAVASGRVVYAGTAVEAYGPLVIVQHADGLVTAYSHNGRILVKSYQLVVQGQPIAEMGAASDGLGMLQFEIRRNGRQLDPVAYLPASGT